MYRSHRHSGNLFTPGISILFPSRRFGKKLDDLAFSLNARWLSVPRCINAEQILTTHSAGNVSKPPAFKQSLHSPASRYFFPHVSSGKNSMTLQYFRARCPSVPAAITPNKLTISHNQNVSKPPTFKQSLHPRASRYFFPHEGSGKNSMTLQYFRARWLSVPADIMPNKHKISPSRNVSKPPTLRQSLHSRASRYFFPHEGSGKNSMTLHYFNARWLSVPAAITPNKLTISYSRNVSKPPAFKQSFHSQAPRYFFPHEGSGKNSMTLHFQSTPGG